MDRFFLAELVREVAPRIVGRRARTLTRWGRLGLTISMATRPRSDIVICLQPEAPAFFLGDSSFSKVKSKAPERLKKNLVGSELVGVKPAPFDRVVQFEWQKSKPSGLQIRFDLIVEWVGTRSAAYLVDQKDREVMDVVSSGPPRLAIGDRFAPLDPPPGAGPLAKGPDEFKHRLADAREERLTERAALRYASGFSPVLADAMMRLHSDEGLALEEAFVVLRDRLEGTLQPVLAKPADPFRGKQARCFLSPVELPARSGWELVSFSSFNEAAVRFIREEAEIGKARQRYLEARAALGRRLKKQKQLQKQLKREREKLGDPAQLRRWGELLLAGLKQATRFGSEVEVPDPYHPLGSAVRVPIDPRLDIAGNAERHFRRARKADKSLQRLDGRLSELAPQIEYLETLELGLEDANKTEDLEAMIEELSSAGILSPAKKAEKSKMPPSTAKPGGPRQFRSASGGLILVGRSGRSNEALTFSLAGPEDLWFHTAGSAGAHVVLRPLQPGDVPEGDVESAAAAAAYFSKARGSTSVEVIYTPRKHVRKIPGGPPGMVRVSRYRTVRVRPAVPSQVDE